jgi:hypothetical protein
MRNAYHIDGAYVPACWLSPKEALDLVQSGELRAVDYPDLSPRAKEAVQAKMAENVCQKRQRGLVLFVGVER